jgi:hypothetical protein
VWTSRGRRDFPRPGTGPRPSRGLAGKQEPEAGPTSLPKPGRRRCSLIPHLVVHGDALPVLKVAAIGAGRSRACPRRHCAQPEPPKTSRQPATATRQPNHLRTLFQRLGSVTQQPRGATRRTSGLSVLAGATLWLLPAHAPSLSRAHPRPSGTGACKKLVLSFGIFLLFAQRFVLNCTFFFNCRGRKDFICRYEKGNAEETGNWGSPNLHF